MTGSLVNEGYSEFRGKAKGWPPCAYRLQELQKTGRTVCNNTITYFLIRLANGNTGNNA